MKKNMILWVLIVVIVIGALIFITIKGKNKMPEKNTSAMAEQVAEAGDIISMNYTGKLQDGTIFDSNVDPKFKHVEPFVFTLGAGQVIPGWDKGIVGMKVGEKKHLEIQPEDAYGANGVPGVIPPNATLIFDVELLDIKK
jgi:FKBP-type peptidyl-prolyl cis-trans isomerase